MGRQCMFLYKHPKESPENKRLLWRLIEKWARPIHNRVDSYAHMTAQQREELDLKAAAEAPPRRASQHDVQPDTLLK